MDMNRLAGYRTAVSIDRVLAFLFIGYGAFALNGYGNDDDTYRMLNTWNILITEGRYVPSRFQGNLIPEMTIGVASHVGGFLLANLVSVVLSIASLYIFYLLLSRITAPTIAVLSTLAVGVNPYWIIASATSMDYVYSAFFFVLGILLLINEKFKWAGIAFAAAVSSRITYGPMAAIAFLLYFFYVQSEPKLKNRLIQSFVLFLLACGVLYLPVFFASGMTLSFLGVGPDAPGGALGTFARFVYKNIYFWGVPAFVLVLAFLTQERQPLAKKSATNPLHNTRVSKLVFHAALWCLIYNEIMFFRLPHEYAYLIPVLFSVVYLIATAEKIKSARYLSFLIGLQLLYGLVFNFDVIQTYQNDSHPKTIHTDSAKVQLSIKEGILIRDMQWRSIYQKYQLDEFNKRWSKP